MVGWVRHWLLNFGGEKSFGLVLVENCDFKGISTGYVNTNKRMCYKLWK